MSKIQTFFFVVIISFLASCNNSIEQEPTQSEVKNLNKNVEQEPKEPRQSEVKNLDGNVGQKQKTNIELPQNVEKPKAVSKPKITQSNCNTVRTKAELERCIDGTWISNDRGQLWKKVVISNGRYKYYGTIPSSGRWGKVKDEGTVTIHEDRFSNSGKRYVFALLKGNDICTHKIIFTSQGAVIECGQDMTQIKKGDFPVWD